MQLLKTTTAVRELLSKLRAHDTPFKFQIQGYLENIVSGKIAYDVFVDAWPCFDAVVAKPKDDAYKAIPMYRVGVYGQCKSVCNMLSAPGFLPYDVRARFVGVPLDCLHEYHRAAQRIGRELELTPKEPRLLVEYKTMPHLLEKYKTRLSDDYYLAPLRSSTDVDTVCRHWRYGSLRYGEDVRASLQYLVDADIPAVGVYERRRGRASGDGGALVSWLLVDIDGAGMSGHTLEEHRGRGIHIWALLDLIARGQAHTGLSYGYIPVSNKASLSNAEFVEAKFSDREVVHLMIKPKPSAQL